MYIAINQAIIGSNTNAGLLLMEPLETNFKLNLNHNTTIFIQEN